jgi:hypothetical protein
MAQASRELAYPDSRTKIIELMEEVAGGMHNPGSR